MAAVKGPFAEIEQAIESLDDVVIANENSTTQVVLAGPKEAINNADKLLTKAGYKVSQLPVSAAFHTPLVEHASKPYSKAVSQETFHKSRIPVFSNTTGKTYPADTKKGQDILASHILHPVIFKTQIEEIYKKGGRVFVEIGPRQILGNLVKDIQYQSTPAVKNQAIGSFEKLRSPYRLLVCRSKILILISWK